MQHFLLTRQPTNRRAVADTHARWNRLFLPVLLLLLGSTGAWAQTASSYAVAQTAATYVAATGGTTLGTVTNDDNNFLALPIGFSFNYAGTAYTTFSVNTNGFIALGSTVTSTNVAISNGFGTNNVVAVLNRDLQGQTGSTLTYQTIGSSPNRTLVVQWAGYRKYNVAGDNFNFQIQLSEGTNAITLAYGAFTNNATAATVQVGLRGASAADFNNRTTTTSWSASTAGTTNDAAMTLSTTVRPGSGQRYVFTVPIPCTAPPTAGTTVATLPNGCGTVSSVLSLSGSATGSGVTYQWQSSSTGTAGSYTNLSAATGSTYAAVGITTDTYYQAIVTCSGQSATSVPVVVRTYSATTVPFAALPLVEGFESWVGRCGNQEVPGTNWRATPITGDASWRRDDQGFSTSAWRYINDEPTPYPTASSQGSHSARFHSYGTATGQGILDLYVNLSAAGTKTLTFDYVNPSGTDVLDVLLSSDGGATFAPAPLLSVGTSSAFSGKSVTFAGTAANSVVRFRATTDFGADDLGIDNLRLNVTPACPGVAFAPTTSVTSTSATINFAAAPGATSYTVNYTPGGTAQTVAAAGAVNLTGLLPYTLYTVTVATNCGSLSGTASTSFRTAIGNDECSGATVLTPGAAGASCNAQTYTTAGATASVVTSPCTAVADGDVWFSFVATGNRHSITVTPTFDLDAVIELRSGACPGTNLNCQNASASSGGAGAETLVATGLTVGTTYLVRVYSATTGASSGNFDICITTPANLPCAQVTGAAVNNTGGTATASTATLTFTPAAGATDYFLTLTPTAGGTTGTATVTGGPVNLTGLTPSTSYTVTISTNCSNGGVSTPVPVVFVSSAPPAVPANDQCAGAIALTCGQAVIGTTNGATTTGDPTATCTTSVTSQPGVFYSYTGTGDIVTVSTCSGPTATTGDTKLFVYSGTCAALVCVDGNDDASGCGTNTLASAVTFPSALGTQYYFFVQGFGSAVNFGLSVTCVATVGNLVVSAPQSVSGTYNNVTVQSGGVATLTGALTVNGALVVQAGGVLAQNCQTLSGTGTFALQAGAELRICDAAGITSTGATGAVQVAGTRTYASDASYTYNGTTPQVTGAGLPGTVRNISVNNTNGVSLSQALSIAQVARLTAGNLATGGFACTLLSNAAGTALVDNTGGVITGTGTMQRAITGAFGGPAYRHFSSPVATTTLADLTTTGFSPTFNAAYNSSATPNLVTPFPTVFGYDQARIATVTSSYGAFDKGWFSPTGSGDAMLVSRGYTANAPATAAAIDFVGTFNNAAQNATALNRGTDAEAGWHLLGNPYPSPLDWSTVTAGQRTGMDAAMYVYQSTGQYAGTYRSYANGVGASPLIDAGSGYFARVSSTGTPGSVTLTNANRVTSFGAQPTFGRGAADARPQLHLLFSGAGLTDETFLYLEQGATAGLDAQYDATKLANPAGLDLVSLTGTTQLAINGLAPLGRTEVVVPLLLQVPQAGTFGFAVADLASFGAATVYLRDALTGTQQLLATGSSYSFTLATATAGTGRFSLVLRPAKALANWAGLDAASVSLYPNPAHTSFTVLLPPLAGQREVQATLFNALGQVVSTRTIVLNAAGATAEFSTQTLATGIYMLRLQADNQAITKRVVVE